MNASKKKSSLRKMMDSEKGYMAGMLDGEGHLYVRGAFDGVSYGVVRVRITDECVVKYLRKITKIGTLNSYTPNQRRKDGNAKKRVYEWLVIKRADVRDLLQTIYPYLVLKKKRAALLLELELLKDQGVANGIEVERIRNGIARERCRGFNSMYHVS